MTLKYKKILYFLLISAICAGVADQLLLYLYINKHFSNPSEYEKTEIRKYPIKDYSLRLDKNYNDQGCFSGPMYDLSGQLVGGAMGFGDMDRPILTHEQCIKKGHNFNLDSITYIMTIDTLKGTVQSFPSFDKKYGEMAYNQCQDTNFTKNKLILQNGNYLMIRGGIPPIATRQKNNALKTLKLAFGTDGDGNYVFVKFYGTMQELQEFLKHEFGRGNPKYNKNNQNSKYAKAAFIYLDGNNIIFDGKCYVARRNSFIKNNIGIVKFAKLQYIKKAPHLTLQSKCR